MQKKSKVFSLVLALVLLVSMLFPAAIFGLENNDSVDRIYGTDRYQTATNVAKSGWPNGAEVVVLAPGMDANLVDALTAAPLAHANDAPILLTEKNALPEATKNFIQLKTETVYVVSGAIDTSVISELEEMEIEVINLGGNDRFSTATNIAQEIENVTGVFVTTAYNNADALFVAAIAAAKGMPVLLAQFDNLPAVEAAYLEEIEDDLIQSYVIGGDAIVADTVKDAIPGEVTRLSGDNRFATNLEVLEYFYAEVESFDKVFVANGTDSHLVDALVASSLAASTDSPVVLVNNDFSEEVKNYVESKLVTTSKIIALGGESLVSSEVLTPNYVRAEDFGVMQFSEVNGYSVGFNLPAGTDKIASVEVSLYKDNTLLATNISNNKLFTLSGPQFSTPFNINGNYAGDAYWEYSDWAGSVYDVPNKAEITVNLFNGKVYSVVNSNLTGDPDVLLTEDEKHIKAEDFGVMQSSGVNGYTAGFSLAEGKNASDMVSIQVSLYDAEDNLLAMNTATHMLLRTTFNQMSSPFNIDGSFSGDVYWNYGDWNGTVADVPAKAVISVTYQDTGRTFTVDNTNLTGSPTKLASSEITTNLASEVMTNEEIDYSVTTVANRYEAEVVRVKATLIEGNEAGFELQYEQDGTFHALAFNDGVAWYGPESGFPLGDITSDFKILYTEEGTYEYKLDIIRLSDDKVLATATNQVTAAMVAPSIESDLGE